MGIFLGYLKIQYQKRPQLGAGDSDVLVRAGNPTRHLYDEHYRIAKYDAAEGHQKSGDVSVGRSGVQDFVFSLEKYQQTMDKCGLADWSGAMNQFAIIFEDRLPGSGFQNSSFTQII